jgi:hypothetical protein
MATTVYMRVGSSWMRRTWVTTSAEAWDHARRVPQQVRRIGEETARGGTLKVEFDTATKTAKERPQW